MEKREYIEKALSLGASDAAWIRVQDIRIDDRFPGYCKEPGCSGYGRSMSCPPHVMGPKKFREYIARFENALAFKFDIPWEILVSEDRYPVFRVLHETATSLEAYAVQDGYVLSKAYAGGSCKNIFCSGHKDCNVLFGTGECRNQGVSTQSMSGNGVDFQQIVKSLHWNDGLDKSTGVIAGIVLVG